METRSVVLAPCADCARQTRHDVVHIVQTQREATGYTIQNTFATLQCRACETVSLQHTTDHGEFDEVEFYPTPPVIRRKVPSWHLLLSLFGPETDVPVAEFLPEIYSAAQTGLCRLTALGLRALLEQVIIAKVGDQESFKKNLEKFMECGYASINQRDALDAVYEAGSAAMHRGFKPSVPEIELMMDAMENVLAAIYGITPHIISSRIPPRRTRLRKTGGETPG